MIEWYHSISLSNKKIKADVIHRKNKTIFEVDAPPVGENWRGGVRKCACLAEDCSSSLFLSLPMPCNAIQYYIHYSSTTWTITFGGCRIDVFDLMFCCCHSFFLSFRSSSWLSPVFANIHKQWIVDNDRLINTDNNGINVWYI
jgi:hypothetical protein